MKKIIVAIFIVYLVVLIKLVLFKGNLFYSVVPTSQDYKTETANASYTGYNLIPFKTIYNFLTSGAATATSIKWYNVLGNVVLFIPFGLFVPFLFSKANKWYQLLIATSAISVLFEVYQYVSRTGNLDVDDVILNSVGGMIGFLCLSIIKATGYKNQTSAL